MLKYIFYGIYFFPSLLICFEEVCLKYYFFSIFVQFNETILLPFDIFDKLMCTSFDILNEKFQ